MCSSYVAFDTIQQIQYHSYMGDFVPNPANYQMKHNPERPLGPRTDAKAFVPNLTDHQLRSLAREKLSGALQAIDPLEQPELTRKLCAELMDRLDGRPSQSVHLDATIKNITVNATISFADQPMVIEHDTTGSNHAQDIDNK